MTITRRTFIGRSSMAILGAGAASTSPFLLRAAEAAAPNDRVLVFVLLRGGVDGLSLCAPYGEAEYYKTRPTIALPKPRTDGTDALLDLDGFFGLHPALAPMRRIWDEGTLAIVHAAGSREMSRSHFDAQEFLETGTPGVRGTTSGWMNRCLTEFPGTSVTQGVAFAPLLPRAYLGSEPVLVTQDLEQFEFQARGWKGEAEALVRAMYAGSGTPIVDAGRQAFETLDVLRRSPAIGARAENGAEYPVTRFGIAMKQAAQVIKARLGTRCIFIHHESAFDTHSDQLPRNTADFTELARSVAAFHRDLGKQNDRVVTVICSEFGRMVAEDGSRGTDHGTGGVMFVLGGRVRGKRVVGRWPGLAKANLFEERDLDVTTDFRDVFAEIATNHLKMKDGASLFPAYRPASLPGIVS